MYFLFVFVLIKSKHYDMYNGRHFRACWEDDSFVMFRKKKKKFIYISFRSWKEKLFSEFINLFEEN